MRILALTNLYPNPYQPHRAPFNRQQLVALAERHEVKVIAPIAWTDELRLRRRAGSRMPADRRVTIGKTTVDHPRYLFPPKMFRRWYGHCFRRCVHDRFEQALAEFHPDVVYATWAYPDGWAAVELAHEAKLRVAVKVHGSDVLLLRKNSARRRRTIEALQRTDAVVAVSRHLARQIEELGVDAARIHVVYNGIDRQLFNSGSPSSPVALGGLDPQTPLLLYVGNLVSVKGPDILIAACQKLQRRGVTFNCRLIGQGPMRRALESQIRQASLQSVVQLLGPRPLQELPAWYRSARALVLPSHSEGVPNVALEALACGTPVIASRVGGVPEVLDNAALVPPGDAEALAAAIQRELARDRQQSAGRFKPLGWDDSAQALAQVLQNLNPKRHHALAA